MKSKLAELPEQQEQGNTKMGHQIDTAGLLLSEIGEIAPPPATRVMVG